MTSPVLPREGCWVGGLMTDRFTVQCRSDQDTDISVDISKRSDFGALVGSSTTESVVTGTHWRGTVTVTGLTAGIKYYWRIRMDNTVDAATIGTEATGTAGSFRTLSGNVSSSWSFAHLSCYHCGVTQNDRVTELIDRMWQSILDRKPTFMIHHDDIYYSDNGPGFPDNTLGGAGNTPYAVGHFYNLDPGTPTQYSLAKYRTNFITTFSKAKFPGDQLISAGQGGTRVSAQHGFDLLAHAQIPGYYMWGDHDRAFDDCSARVDSDEVIIAVGDELARWDAGRDAGHEMFMDLNAPLIDAETGRSWTSKSTEDAYYYIDIPPMRLIVLDDATWRDDVDNVDSATHQLLGTTQEAWALDLIANNPEKFLVISLGANMAGNHGFDTDFDWTWEFYSYARDTLLNAIWATNQAHRTLLISGDTHELGVLKHQGENFDQPTIYELMAGNASYIAKLHGFINGLNTGDNTVGSSLDAMWVDARGYAFVEHIGGRLRASIISIQQQDADGSTPAKVLYQRWFS